MALKDVKVVEIAGLAPAPFAGLCLADFGADVIRIDRAGKGKISSNPDTLCRGKRSIALDLKSEYGKKVFLQLIEEADVLIEPFRPGVMEKLGFGPDILLALNPRLVYARMTGFGQGGEPIIEKAAGHDTNYLAQSGILSALRAKGEKPNPPVNLLGDFGGGGLICAFGILLALLERVKSNQGQVVDAAMIDGVAYLSSVMVVLSQLGLHSNKADDVGTNLLDSGAHFYDTYICKDGRFFSVGAIEPQFYKLLLEKLELSEKDGIFPQMDRDNWPKMKQILANQFKTRNQAEWADIFKGVDACAFPILNIDEAIQDTHNQKRNVFSKSKQYPGLYEATAAPKLSRTPSQPLQKFPIPGEHSVKILENLGYSKEDIRKIMSSQQVLSAKL